MRRRCTLGIVAPLISEARWFPEWGTAAAPPVVDGTPVRLGEQALLVVSGMGEAAARLAAITLADRGVSLIISWGTAGGLSSVLRTGDIFLPDEVLAADGTRYTLQPEKIALPHALPTLLGGRMVSQNKVIASVALKKALASASSALAVDMETAAIAAVAKERHLPCAAIRGILDSSSLSLPEGLLRHLDPFGRMALLPFLGDVLLGRVALLPVALLAIAHTRLARNMRTLGAVVCDQAA